MGLAGFRERPVNNEDPLVCGCGATIGTQNLLRPENAASLKEARRQHRHVCRDRLRHQTLHRTLDGSCPECQP